METTFRLLGHYQWARFAEAAGADDPYVCDLTRTQVVYPPGVVGLTLVTHARGHAGRPTTIVPPDSRDVRNYLGRIDFFDQIHPSVDVAGDISELEHHRRRSSPRFTELIAARDQGFDDVAEVVWEHLSDRSLQEARAIFPAFDELLTNIAEHSDPESGRAAQCFVHVQTYAQDVGLAFGDLGVGYLRTLRRNPQLPALADETDALRGVLCHGYSRLAHEEEDRGGGLRHIHNLVGRLEGRMKLLSRDGIARTRPPPDQSSWRLNPERTIRLSRLTTPFPGTLAWIQMPRGAATDTS